ncbi:uncharacterized protein LOC124162968 [Ischnura elegans]|uniref:uncharacterized protein LOC124162968 n=1 Tax=Ischnura elegans TaxID=197161 RepID=UPI001ED89328|nr:uncharacterized protein LOC124162968 [Ischnura elegans]
MSAVELENLLNFVGPKIQKRDTFLRESISASQRLIVTLRFLASGDSYHSLMYLFRIPVSTMSIFIPEVCAAIYDTLKETVMKMPGSKEKWIQIAEGFETTWDFPNCIGALDGKHIVMQAPPNSGSLYFNYKGTHSIVLLAMVDSCYKFIYIDVGCYGRISDGGVFNNSSLKTGIVNGALNLPNRSALKGRQSPLPYVVVADDAFALSTYLMKPYPFRNPAMKQRVYNYRLSRCRRIVENVFGLVANRFRVLRKPMLLHPERVKTVVLAICTLHNYLMEGKESVKRYAPVGTFDVEATDTGIVADGSWRSEEGIPDRNLIPLQTTQSRNHPKAAELVRTEFTEYFSSPQGKVHWQYRHI